jgi:hypothetical protein
MELDLVVGRVTKAEAHAGARGQSVLLSLELGPRGDAQAALPVPLEAAEALVGRQVVCAIEDDGARVLTAHSHGAGVVVLEPAQDVEDGTPVA